MPLINQEIEVPVNEIDILNKKSGDVIHFLDTTQKIKTSEGKHTFARYEAEIISIEPTFAKLKIKKRIR